MASATAVHYHQEESKVFVTGLAGFEAGIMRVWFRGRRADGTRWDGLWVLGCLRYVTVRELAVGGVGNSVPKRGRGGKSSPVALGEVW